MSLLYFTVVSLGGYASFWIFNFALKLLFNDNVELRYDLKDLIDDVKVKAQMDSYICKVCHEGMKPNQEWYKCSNGHMACKGCWIRILNSENTSCWFCRVSVESFYNGLSRCTKLEKSFNNILVKCPYSFNVDSIVVKSKLKNIVSSFLKSSKFDCNLERYLGCNESVRIGQLEYHMQSCEYRFIKCKNQGCSVISRLKSDHESKCEHSIIDCANCGLSLKKQEYYQHIEVIRCGQSFGSAQWVINSCLDKIDFIKHSSAQAIQSQVITFKGIEFMASIRSMDEKCYLFLTVLNLDPNSTISVQFSFKIFNSDNCSSIKKSYRAQFTRSSNSWGLPLDCSSIFNEYSGYLFKDGSARLEISINQSQIVQIQSVSQ